MGYVVNKRRFKPSGPSEYTVTLNVFSHITHTGGNLVQADLSGPMVPVTIIPDDTYKLNQGAGTYSGITVTVSGRNLVISGTPTANVTLSFTTSQNADILTSTQKNFANWTKSRSSSYGFLFNTGVSNSYIPWRVKPVTGVTKNQGYYYDLSSLPFDTPFQFSLTYKVETVGSYSNSGCAIGISSTNLNGNISVSMLGDINIPTTQTNYITQTVNITRSSSVSNCYLVIINSNYNSNYTEYQGKIYIQEMTLREI